MVPDFPRTYSLANLVLFFGSLIPGGFGEGDAFTIEQTADDWVVTEGVDGSIAFGYTSTSLFVVKINLLQTSPMNAQMSAIRAAQAISKVPLPLAFKDALGADAFKASACVIQKPPTVARSSKPNSQEWPILCGGGTLFLGGN